MFAVEGVLVTVGATFDNPPEANVLKMNADLDLESDMRGWALAWVTVRAVAGE